MEYPLTESIYTLFVAAVSWALVGLAVNTAEVIFVRWTINNWSRWGG